ncbi:MAG: endonuclease/exonuclease/phosphatase family protein [Gordonia sp. (in: high G+C Gram-positive bacteria)]|uniref:endonuclease/exonuclease/phosphatase family protein n=1 Tax=Gordonia sp. (in: high G+C Gram-positive bacteria) TaxID=84139 RepID=UPI0039E38E88
MREGWDASGPWRRTGLLFSALCLLIGAGGFWLHFTRIPLGPLVNAAAFAPYLMAVSLVGLATALIVRSGRLVGGGLLVVLVSLCTQAPLYLDSSDGAEPELTVLQINLGLGEGDVDALADVVNTEEVDLLAVTELTEPALAAIESSSILRRLPHAYTRPARAGNGGGILSRYPITERTRLDGFWLPNLRTVIDVPGAAPLTFYGLHVMPPYPDTSAQWRSELGRLHAEFRGATGPVIAAGDYNATYDHRAFRALTAPAPTGPAMLDAAEHTGAGMVRTYPADRFFPPLLALDRILARGGPEPIEFRRIAIPDSDHHAVLARFRGSPDRR